DWVRPSERDVLAGPEGGAARSDYVAEVVEHVSAVGVGNAYAEQLGQARGEAHRVGKGWACGDAHERLTHPRDVLADLCVELARRHPIRPRLRIRAIRRGRRGTSRHSPASVARGVPCPRRPLATAPWGWPRRRAPRD